MTIIRTTVREKGIIGLYSGCSALVVGNAIKAGVRFVSYDHFKSILADSEVSTSRSLYSPPHAPQGKVSAPKSLLGQPRITSIYLST